MAWNVSTFFTRYTMLIVDFILHVFWKLVKHTKTADPLETDLVGERPIIDAYEAALMSPPTGFWDELLHLSQLRTFFSQGQRLIY